MKTLKVLICIPVVFFIFSQTLHAQTAPAPGGWVAQLVSVEGSAQLKKAGETKWSPARLNDKLYPGDMLRVMDKSRAALVMSNQSNVRLDENTTSTFKGVEEENIILLDVLKGAAHFFNRVSRTLKIFTPYVNGTAQGTEFLVKVDDNQALISIFEGRVSAENNKGSLIANGGQTVIAKAGEAPMLMVVVKPRDAVQWALYYPSIMDFRPEDFSGTADWQDKARRSVEACRKGDLAGANEALKDLKDEALTNTRYLTYRATLALSVGRLEEASAYLDRTIKADPNNANAYALQSVIAVVQNRKDDEMNLAKKATGLDPKSSAALIAQSYAQQARYDVKGATASVQEAVENSPNDAYARTRLAELWLSQGYLDRALDEANRAVAINPNIARTQTVLGYAYLTQVKIKESKAAFEKAIALDSADPLARLGLGLAKIRKGNLEEGRKEIEIAASLDVNNSLIRSYLGKAYYEEKREKLSGDQFQIAKQLDPMDPTPFFYDSIMKQSVNRPVEALADMQKSIDRNDNRAVYRSKLLLDEDLAARSVSLGRIYSDLGFSVLGLVEAWKSVNSDPTNFSAHRLMADLYASEPRHKIARVSEVLQSQLLQPININPVQPQFTQANLNIFKGAGPANPSYNEFNPLFNRNQVNLQMSGVAGQHGIRGDEVAMNAIYDRYSLSLGQFYYKSDGFRPNNDQTMEIYNVFAQAMLSYQTSVQFEARYTDHQYGDLSLLFDPNWYYSDQRQTDRVRYFRGGLRHSFAPGSDVILNFSYNKADNSAHVHIPPVVDPGNLTFDLLSDMDDKPKGYLAEAQYLFRSDAFRAIIGGGYADIRSTFSDNTQFTGLIDGIPIFSDQSYTTQDYDIHHWNAYTYTYTNFPKNVTWTLGVSADWWNSTQGDLRKDKVNPKAGVLWNPTSSTTIRAAAFRAVKRTMTTYQTIEPTQIAGFNQFFDEIAGTDYWRYGIGLDQKILANLFAGLELSKRDLKVPCATVVGTDQYEYYETNWREELARVYLYWAAHQWLALTAEYRYERFKRDPDFPGSEAFHTVNTHRVPLGVNFYHPSGLIAQFKETYVYQDGDFIDRNKTWTTPPFNDQFSTWKDDFWVSDALLGFRLPKRYGMIAVEVKNIFDKGHRFQDTDPASPSIFPERTIIGRITLNF